MDQPRKNNVNSGLLLIVAGIAGLGLLLFARASSSDDEADVKQPTGEALADTTEFPSPVAAPVDRSAKPESAVSLTAAAADDAPPVAATASPALTETLAAGDQSVVRLDSEPVQVSNSVKPQDANDQPVTKKNQVAEDQNAAPAGNNSLSAESSLKPQRNMPWKTWPQPQAAFMLTGEQHGFFEPCGCTANQLGGMSRRADLFNKLAAAGWKVRGLDVGGLSRRHVRQAQIKFETTLAALRQLKYAAIAIGPEELRLKPDFLLTQHITDGEQSLAFLSANLEFYGIPDLGTPLASTVIPHGGLKVGLTAVFSEELKKRALPLPDITWKDPVPELQKVMAAFDEQNVDVRILLSQSTVEESVKFAEQFPSLNIILTAEGVGDPNPQDAPRKVGDTLIIETGRKGKYVGVLGVYPNDPENPFRYQLVELQRDDFDETESMIRLMANYQERLKDEKIVLADAVTSPHPSGATFVGADKCGECHTTAYEIWKKTPHAHALESLDPVHQRYGFERLNGVVRMHDPECLSCHVTGWEPQEYFRFPSGFLNEDLASNAAEKTLHQLLAGSQCENCHGPGSRHLELVESGSDDPGKVMRVTLKQARNGTCEKCHDADNSPEFDFDTYWEKVKHEGLD